MFTHSKQNGFTLVETFVAVTALLFVVVGVMTVVDRSMRAAIAIQDQTLANILAQEAIESVRQLRDVDSLRAYDALVNNKTSIDTWGTMSAFINMCDDGAFCKYEQNAKGDPIFSKCNTDADCEITVNVDGKYGHGYSTYTPYTRKISVTNTVNDGGVVAAQVAVTVSWSINSFIKKEVTLQTWIYDQYKYFE